jgi:hypothetical protein
MEMDIFSCKDNFCVRRGINLRKIAEQMTGSSGAEVKGVCTEAGKCFFFMLIPPYSVFSKAGVEYLGGVTKSFAELFITLPVPVLFRLLKSYGSASDF